MKDTYEEYELRTFSSRAEMVAIHEAEQTLHNKKQCNMAEYTRKMAAQNGFAMSDFLGPSKKRNLAHARFHVWAHLHGMGFSLSQIGGYFSGRDHTTILYGIQQARQMAAEHAEGTAQCSN